MQDRERETGSPSADYQANLGQVRLTVVGSQKGQWADWKNPSHREAQELGRAPARHKALAPGGRVVSVDGSPPRLLAPDLLLLTKPGR